MTHAITYLPKVDKIIVLKEGRVSESGTFDTLLRNDGAFAQFIRTYMVDAESGEEDSDEEEDTEGIYVYWY